MKPFARVSRLAFLCAVLFAPATAHAQEPILGQLMIFGGNFCPRGWANADGQLMPISQYQALFSVFGTMYGGDGRQTFALPDLRGRVPLHVGQGPGLANRRQGEKGGAERHTLNVQEMPGHSHTMLASPDRPNQKVPNNNLLGSPKKGSHFTNSPNLAPMNSKSVGMTGGGRAHNIMQPFQAIRYCVALTGVYPSRN